MTFRIPITLVVLLLPILSGCTSPRLERELSDRPMGKAYQPVNIFADPVLSAEFQTVLVLPFAKTGLSFEWMPAVESAMISSLRKAGRFNIVVLPAEALYDLTGSHEIPMASPVPASVLEVAWQQYQADGVLQMEVTAFRPYKPMEIGVQGRLFQTAGNRVIWSCDEFFDAGNQAVVTGARKYAETYLDQRYPLQSSYSALLTPQRFGGYVGHVLFETLPVRPDRN